MTLKGKDTPDETENAQIQAFKKKRQFKEDDVSIVKRSKGGKGYQKRKRNETEIPEGEKPDWKKVKKDKKDLKLHRKQEAAGSNELYELGVNAKKMWEEMRREDCKKERKEQLCKELYAIIKGRVKTLIYAHDTVRVVETLIACGGEEYRSCLFVELKDDLVELSKNKYSRFFVLKLLRYGTKAQKDTIMAAMKGQVVQLMGHKIACEVVELAYNDYANAKQRSHMIQEFYSPRLKHFKEDIHNLEGAIEKFPESKKEILEDVKRFLTRVLEKGTFTNTLIHTLLKEYMQVCEEEEHKEIIESLKEGLLPIIHTRDGARVGMMCLWYGTAKDRKVILRSFKTKFLKIATEEFGHMVLLAAFDCVDDTVFVKKAVLEDLCQHLDELVHSESGVKVLKYLISPRNKVFCHPDVIKILSRGDGNPNSKKDAAVRHSELKEGIQNPILELIKENVNIWARDSHWTLFLGAALQNLDGEAISGIFGDLAEICAEPYMIGIDDHFLESSYMNKMFTYIVQGDKQRFENKKEVFSTCLIEVAESELPGWVATNRGCFMLIHLIETEIPEVVEKITTLVKAKKSRLKKMKFTGATILLKKIN